MKIPMNIRWRNFGLGSITLSLGLSICAAASKPESKSIPARYSQIPFPQWSYQPPYPKDYRVELNGGAVAYLLPDSTLDVVKLALLCAHPNLPAQPGASAGLRLYSDLLKDGGTTKLKPDHLEDSLEFMAASVSASLQDFQSDAAFDALGKDADALLGLLPDVVLHPGLDAEVFKVDQRHLLESLKHRYDTPRGVMGAAYEKVMHGSHPSNWSPTETEVQALTPTALRPWLGLGYTRRGMVLGVSGRFNRDDMIRRLNVFVSSFPAGGDSVKVPPFKGPKAPGIYLVDKPFSQATIRLGAMGVQRPNPDYYRLVVASYIFGDGGFTSRLVERVRSNEGLAYGIGSEVESDYDRTGTVYVGLQTKAPTGAYAIKLILEEMRRMDDKGITDEELAKAKEGLLKSLPSLFDTPANTARIFAQGEIWKRSPDHYVEYQKTLQAMTRQEVEAAFRKYFNPDSLRLVIVGPKNILLQKDETHQASLADFGKLHDLTQDELDKRE